MLLNVWKKRIKDRRSMPRRHFKESYNFVSSAPHLVDYRADEPSGNNSWEILVGDRGEKFFKLAF
jgi:hypothetical protein